jgi:DegV family protein with EDD domain
VTDSAASLPPELAAELDITVVPISVRFGDRAMPDTEGPETFYARLRNTMERVTTSTPSPGDFATAFESTGAPAILCVTLSSSVSGIHQAAGIAANEVEADVEVVDSGTASMAQGLVALEAARAVREGADLAEAGRRARDVAGRSRLLAVIETFEYLRRSGRVNRLTSYAGTMLDIKPVFRMQGGAIEGVARPRTRRRALDRLVEEALRDIGGRPVHLAAVHADAEDDARRLLDRVADGLQVLEAHVAGFTPGIGAHTGPGAVGLAWFCEEPAPATR